MKRGVKSKEKMLAVLLAAALAVPNAGAAAAGKMEQEENDLIDTSTAMQHTEKSIKVKAGSENRLLLYQNAKNQVRLYVCSTKKVPVIYKISDGQLKKDKKEPILRFTKRKKRTKPYGDYGTPVWNSTRTAFYTDHFNSIYKCDKNGKELKKVNVLKKMGLNAKDYWIRKIEQVENELFAVSVMNQYDDTEKIYLYDMKKNKIRKKYASRYQRLLGTTKTSLYLVSYDDEEPFEVVKTEARTGRVEGKLPVEPMTCRETGEVIGTMYNDELYLCNEKGIFMWNEDSETYDPLVDGTHSFKAGKNPYDMLFTADDELFVTTEGNRMYRYRMRRR